MDPVWGWIARLTLAALFAAAGLSKLYRPAAFRAAVADYDLVPSRAVASVALALASAEAAAALLLLVPASRMAGASLLWAMLALFSAAILRTRVLPRWIGAYGAILGPATIVALAAGHLRLDVHGFGLVVLLQSAWLVAAGIVLCRRERPAAG